MAISILENEYVKCEFDDSLPVLKHRWLKEPSGEVFKANLLGIKEEYIKLKKSHNNLAWMADTVLLGELDEEVEAWLVNIWEDTIFNKAGVRIHAVILGASIYADYPMEKFKIDAEEKHKLKNIFLGIFSNEKDAYLWIIRKQKLLTT